MPVLRTVLLTVVAVCLSTVTLGAADGRGDLQAQQDPTPSPSGHSGGRVEYTADLLDDDNDDPDG